MKQLITVFLFFFFTASFAQDSMGSSKPPVKINAVRVVLDKNLGDKRVEIDFTNVSKQRITKVKFTWLEESTGVKANSEVQHGDITDLYKPGKRATAKFGTDDPQLQSVKELTVYEVTFEDGSVWKFQVQQ